MTDKNERHAWYWNKPGVGQRQCQKCGKVSTIKSHSSLGGCKLEVKLAKRHRSTPDREKIRKELGGAINLLFTNHPSACMKQLTTLYGALIKGENDG